MIGIIIFCCISYCICIVETKGRNFLVCRYRGERRKDIVSADEVSPVNIDGNAILNTSIISKSSVPAAPSSWYDV
jgi:hypothetical protein